MTDAYALSSPHAEHADETPGLLSRKKGPDPSVYTVTRLGLALLGEVAL